MFTMAAVKPLCFGVFAFVFPFSFLFMTTGTNRFAESVVSLLCAWRQKKQNKNKGKPMVKPEGMEIMFVSVMQDWGQARIMTQIYTLEMSEQHGLLVPPLVKGQAL